MKDIKEKAEKLIKKIQKDKDFEKKFKKDPVKAVEEVLGVDLPDDTINSIIETVKAKITIDDITKATKTIKNIFKQKESK